MCIADGYFDCCPIEKGFCPDDYTHIDRAAVFQDVSKKLIATQKTRERCNDCDGQKSKIDAENRLQKRIEGDGEREQSVRKRILGELDISNFSHLDNT